MRGDEAREVATLDAVARAAGVSRATASRVLSGSTHVSAAARERVTSAAAALAYVPNGAARTLVTRRSGAVAFVVCEREDKFFSDPFFAAVLKGAQRVVAQHRRQLLFAVVSGDEDRDQLVRYAAGGHLDGAIVLSAHAGETTPGRLRALGIPVAMSGRPPQGVDPGVPYVDSDNVVGGRTATEHLLGLGRRCLGVVTGPEDMAASQDRLDGWRRALADSGAEVRAHEVTGDFTTPGGRRAMAELLDRAPDLDGVFAANDLMAVGALTLLRQRGRRVPEDVAVVGYDDIPLAAAVDPPLTTVRQPMEVMGRQVAAAVIGLLDGRGAPDGADAPGPLPLLPVELVVRSST